MNLTCSKETLLENINIVLKAVSSKTTLNILECILLIVDKEGFRLIGNDLEMGIETKPIESEIIELGSVALEAKYFSEVIRKLPNKEINISSNEKNLTTIKCGSSEFKLLGLSGTEFPFLNYFEKNNEYRILSNDLKEIIKETIFSVSVDDSKPMMTGELLEISDKSVKMVSVDGFRISTSSSQLINEPNENIVAVIPAKTLNEIGKLITSDEEVSIYFTTKHILFEFKNCIVISRLLEGDFINYDHLFNDDYTTLINVNRTELLESMERSSLLSREIKKSPVKIQIDNNNMIISSQTDIGTTHEELAVQVDGVAIEIGFNPKYIIDVLKVMTDEKITIQYTTPLSPCIIKGLDKDHYKYLVLPLRLK